MSGEGEGQELPLAPGIVYRQSVGDLEVEHGPVAYKENVLEVGGIVYPLPPCELVEAGQTDDPVLKASGHYGLPYLVRHIEVELVALPTRFAALAQHPAIPDGATKVVNTSSKRVENPRERHLC